MGGLFLYGGLFSIAFLVLPLVLVLALLVILALRHDDDADGGRAPAIYGALIAFIGFLTLLFAATGLTASMVSLTSDDTAVGRSSDDFYSEGSFDDEPSGTLTVGRFERDDDDAAVTSAMRNPIAGVAALGLLRVHRSLFDRRTDAVGAARRVHRAYLLVLCFTVAVVGTAAAGAGAYALFRALFPGTADVDNRADEVRTLVTLAVLFLGSAALWREHWKELDLGAPPEVSEAVAP
jgi:hypothetical protein